MYSSPAFKFKGPGVVVHPIYWVMHISNSFRFKGIYHRQSNKLGHITDNPIYWDMLETIQYIGKYYRQSNTFQYIRKGSNIYGIHKTQSNIVSGIFYFYLLSITSFKTIKIENVGRVLKILEN